MRIYSANHNYRWAFEAMKDEFERVDRLDDTEFK
jgi:hypothetical protein